MALSSGHLSKKKKKKKETSGKFLISQFPVIVSPVGANKKLSKNLKGKTDNNMKILKSSNIFLEI